MIHWGIYGPGASGAGLYLANHHNFLGPYFGDIEGNEWPHVPLHKEPTSLEDDFNQLLMSFAAKLSNDTLKNVSLLDIPAFGSSIVTLRKELKKQFIWPIKANFALLKSNPSLDKKTLSVAYKSLMDDWADYLELVDHKDSAIEFSFFSKHFL